MISLDIGYCNSNSNDSISEPMTQSHMFLYFFTPLLNYIISYVILLLLIMLLTNDLYVVNKPYFTNCYNRIWLCMLLIRNLR